jgi:hypothetical protein
MRALVVPFVGLLVAFAGGSCASSEPSGAAPGSLPDSGSSVGSCNPTYCPASGAGVACCVTANGPCGLDYGTGCLANSAGDAGAG